MEPVNANLSGKTCLVTGATAGIGKEIARGLVRCGARVVLTARSPERGERAREELARTTSGAEVEVLAMDLSDQRSIREAAARFRGENERLHVLVNNAGVWATTRRTSPDGLELTFATNVIGYHLLTRELRPMLERSAPARVVNVASSLARDLDLTDLQFERRRYDGMRAYAQSKQADRMLTWAWAERLLDARVTVNACHPGMVNSELTRDATGVVGLVSRALFRVAGRSPERGADTPLWLAASVAAEGVTNKLWKDRAPVVCPYRDPAQVQALWDAVEALVAPSAPAAGAPAS